MLLFAVGPLFRGSPMHRLWRTRRWCFDIKRGETFQYVSMMSKVALSLLHRKVKKKLATPCRLDSGEGVPDKHRCLLGRLS